MTGHTNPDGLPYPDDPAALNNSLVAFSDLAQATQQALVGRAAAVHTHTPSKSGIVSGTWTVGNLNPGETKQLVMSKPARSTVLVTVQHFSTWIFAVANATSDTVVAFSIRNSTTNTAHTNVKMYYAFIPPG